MNALRSALFAVLAAWLNIVSAEKAGAATVELYGTIEATEGHEAPACRRVTFKRADTGAIIVLRIPATGVDDGLFAIALTAVVTKLSVVVTYDPAVTTGCGTEPKLMYISINAN